MTLPTQGVSDPEPMLNFSGPACDREAARVRSYCEGRFPVGPSSERRRSITGETFTELCVSWHDGFATIELAGEAAMASFQKHANGKSGTLYWRVPPEIAWGSKQKKFAYYMRLLISDKPRI